MSLRDADQQMSLRDRKRARTRQALVDAATELFARNGYEQTTIAEIAAAADIAPRTFFSYFATKEDLVFPERDERVGAAIAAIASRQPGEGPMEVLLRSLRTLGEHGADLANERALLRVHISSTVPAVRGRGLQIQADAQREIARHLAEAFPDQLDIVGAHALTGAFIGAFSGALHALLDPANPPAGPAELTAAVHRAMETAIAPWLAASRSSAAGQA